MEEERVWAVVLLGLGLLLGLLGSCLHLKDEAERLKLKLCSFLVKSWNYQGCPKRPRGGASPCAHTSLVLASPFSEWFSSFASASAFSFAFLVFLSSFLSFTAFSFCSGLDKQWACWASTNALPPPSNTTSFSLSPSPPSSPLVPAWAGPVSGERRGKRCGNCYAWIQQHYRSIYDSLEPVFSQYFWMFMRTLVHERHL